MHKMQPAPALGFAKWHNGHFGNPVMVAPLRWDPLPILRMGIIDWVYVGRFSCKQEQHMILLIIIFGALICVAGIVILFDPEIVFGFLRKNADRISLQVLAVVVRLVLGAALVYQSDVSRYPVAIEIIGWLSIVAAVFFAVIGRVRFRRLMAWALSRAKYLGRVGGLLALAFGTFLIHAFV